MTGKEMTQQTTEDEDNIKVKKSFNLFIQRHGYSYTCECENCPQIGNIHYMKQHAFTI